MNTRTGHFPIGFRRGGTNWQKEIHALIAWSKANAISCIDLGKDAPDVGQAVLDAGLRIGSVDLLDNKGMISPDKTTRDKAIAANAQYVESCAQLGAVNHFLVMLPEKPELPRSENFGFMVDSFRQLAPALEAHNARLVIEGWPGPGALCCTPEGYRAFFNEVSSPAMGVNYDPSHLVRMGIDYLRFLREFGGRVYHVHGKDTELLAEETYEYGTEQPATFARPIRFGAHAWRYTIPGHGQVRWVEVMRGLQALNYQGCVSIELEDANFNGATESEQQGILLGARFLAGV
ncbi:MAG: sugar phosphate isomerase/epimerase [Caldilineaceae bacterium]|nr:sugar phosphate isomerase/epimerase [Caldilineaceae bacterium]